MCNFKPPKKKNYKKFKFSVFKPQKVITVKVLNTISLTKDSLV